jgi:hypothetical protein
MASHDVVSNDSLTLACGSGAANRGEEIRKGKGEGKGAGRGGAGGEEAGPRRPSADL